MSKHKEETSQSIDTSQQEDESMEQRSSHNEEFAWSRPNTSHIKNKMKNTYFQFFIFNKSSFFIFTNPLFNFFVFFFVLNDLLNPVVLCIRMEVNAKLKKIKKKEKKKAQEKRKREEELDPENVRYSTTIFLHRLSILIVSVLKQTLTLIGDDLMSGSPQKNSSYFRKYT
jgi:hypothetical protein